MVDIFCITLLYVCNQKIQKWFQCHSFILILIFKPLKFFFMNFINNFFCATVHTFSMLPLQRISTHQKYACTANDKIFPTETPPVKTEAATFVINLRSSQHGWRRANRWWYHRWPPVHVPYSVVHLEGLLLLLRRERCYAHYASNASSSSSTTTYYCYCWKWVSFDRMESLESNSVLDWF